MSASGLDKLDMHASVGAGRFVSVNYLNGAAEQKQEQEQEQQQERFNSFSGAGTSIKSQFFIITL